MERDVTFGDENDVHFSFDAEENQLCVGKEEKDECWYAPIGNKDEHLCGENDNFEKLEPRPSKETAERDAISSRET